MFWLGLVGFLIVIALLITMFSFIRGEFYFSRVKDNDTLSMEMRALFGLVRYRYVIPIIQFKSFAQGIMIKSETVNKTSTELKDATKDHITKEKVVEFFKQAKIALVNTLNFYDWMKQTLAKVQCTEIKWITRIGIGDAPETAITTGAIWAIKSSLLGFAAKFVQVQTRPRVEVIPQYNEPQFSTEFRLAGRIRVWFVLFAGVRLLARAAKIKGGIRTWYQIFLKARAKMAS
ncbi:DUF2953 domain-containing protein [Paenibacillus sp. GCM10027628]|uniref:DUF2953 domain-containing protein n=1 Tax=Paenibacillus sp. GCM10027628 TaxID=3273413 RepID=UPI003625087D